MGHQDRWGSEQVTEGVVEQVDAGGRVQVCVTHELAGKQSLSGATPQQAAHLPIGQIHPIGHHLHPGLNGSDVWALSTATVQVLVQLS